MRKPTDVLSLAALTGCLVAASAIAAGCANEDDDVNVVSDQGASSLSAAPAAVRSSTSAVSSTGRLSLALPASTSSGDVLVAFVTCIAANQTVTAPTGWIAVAGADAAAGTTDVRMRAFYKVAGAAEPASFTFMESASYDLAGGLFAIRGADTSRPIDAAIAKATTSPAASCAVPSLTTTVANTLLLFGCGANQADSFTPPSGMNEAWDVASNGSFAPYRTATEGAFQVASGAGATGPRNAVLASATKTAAVLVAIRSAVGAGSPPNDAGALAPDAGGSSSADGGSRADATVEGGADAGATHADAGAVPWFPSSFVWQPIASGAAPHPDSARLAASVAAVANKGFILPTGAYDVPFVYATPNDPRQSVHLTYSWGEQNPLLAVPLPSSARPAAGSDGHLVIIDSSGGAMYEFWQAAISNGVLSASVGNKIAINGDGNYPATQPSCRAVSFALVNGLLTIDDIKAGVIRHALAFSYDYPAGGPPASKYPRFVAPSRYGAGSASDGAAYDAIPEGARLRLKASVDLSGLPAWQRAIGQALKDYGMYLVDGGGGVTLAVEGNPTGWQAIGIAAPYDYAPSAWLSQLEVLQW